MSKVLVLIDYENLHVGANKQHSLVLKNQGLDHLLSVFQNHGQLKKEDTIVAAYWDDFREAKDYFRKKFYHLVDVMTSGDSVTDGYLIIEGILKFERALTEVPFEEIVIVSGDSVNVGLVGHFLSKGCKVNIYSWKKCCAAALSINSDVKIYDLEEIFGISSGLHLQNGWLEAFTVTNEEYAIISRVLNSKFNDLFLTKTARDIYQSLDTRYSRLTTYDEAHKFLMDCTNKGIFTMIRKPGSQGRDSIKVLELNHQNPKVEYVKSRISSSPSVS